jgi:site-specific DNA recombinase
MRTAIYARYSSDNQKDASIEDQVRLCRERVTKENWTLSNVYSDHAISGASLMRPGIQALMSDAINGKIDMIVCEALDRLSRDQEDIAGLYKRMVFANVKIVTLSEGEISNLHIGLKGTMNALFLKDLADKTRRGMRGRIEHGKAGGGITYGYDVVKKIDQNGEYVRGERVINQEQSAVVLRIFEEYVRGVSPRAIATQLNKDHIPGPQGGEWGASTIYGNRQRGTGILNNELYVGKLVWNRLRYMKDPETGKRVSRLNPEADLVITEVPDLRVIEQSLWDQVKAMQGQINVASTPLWTKNRPRTLFAGLIKCSCCGGGFILISKDRLGCATSRNKGTCDNRLTMKLEDLEHAVLRSMHSHLMDEELCGEFCREYTRRMNELRNQHNASLGVYRKELVKLERERQQIVQSICDGVPGELVRDRAVYVQSRKEELQGILDSTEVAPVLFHPNMATRYQKEIKNLIASLNHPESKQEAAMILRSLIDRIMMTPVPAENRLAVDLVGDLAGILSIATNRDRLSVQADLSKLQPVQQDDTESGEKHRDSQNSADLPLSAAMVAGNRLLHQPTSDNNPSTEKGKGPRLREPFASTAVVAGAGFEPATFRL